MSWDVLLRLLLLLLLRQVLVILVQVKSSRDHHYLTQRLCNIRTNTLRLPPTEFHTFPCLKLQRLVVCRGSWVAVSVSRDLLLLQVLVVVIAVEININSHLPCLGNIYTITLLFPQSPMEFHTLPYLKLRSLVCRHSWVAASVSRDLLLLLLPLLLRLPLLHLLLRLLRLVVLVIVLQVKSDIHDHHLLLPRLRFIRTTTTTQCLPPTATEFCIIPFLKLQRLVCRHSWVEVSVSLSPWRRSTLRQLLQHHLLQPHHHHLH